MLGRLLASVFYGALAVAALAFIFSNRAPVEVSLFPFGLVAEMPLYLALTFVFVVGLALGLSYSALLAIKYRRLRVRDRRLIVQLEHELAEKPSSGQLAST